MGELRAFLKNLKPDYRGGLSRSFEDMAMHMFMCELGLDVPPLRHINQKGIEADPVDLYQSGSYAFQAKHYDEKTELKDRKDEFIKSVRDAKTYGVTDLYFYVNKDLGQNTRNRGQDAVEKPEHGAQHPDSGTGMMRQRGSGKKDGSFHISEIKNWFIRDYRSDFQRSVEEDASARPSMKVHWRTADKIEKLLEKPEYGYIRRVYLANEGENDLFGYYQSVTEKVCKCDEEESLYGNISLLEGYIEPRIRERGSRNGNRIGNVSSSIYRDSPGSRGDSLSVREYLESWVRGKNEWISIICGEPGHGKTSLCQKAVHDFYVDKWLAGTVKNVFCVSINPAGSKAEQEIRTTGKFSLESLFSWGEGAARSKDSQDIRKEDLQNALLFLDALMNFWNGCRVMEWISSCKMYPEIFAKGLMRKKDPISSSRPARWPSQIIRNVIEIMNIEWSYLSGNCNSSKKSSNMPGYGSTPKSCIWTPGLWIRTPVPAPENCSWLPGNLSRSHVPDPGDSSQTPGNLSRGCVSTP